MRASKLSCNHVLGLDFECPLESSINLSWRPTIRHTLHEQIAVVRVSIDRMVLRHRERWWKADSQLLGHATGHKIITRSPSGIVLDRAAQENEG